MERWCLGRDGKLQLKPESAKVCDVSLRRGGFDDQGSAVAGDACSYSHVYSYLYECQRKDGMCLLFLGSDLDDGISMEVLDLCNLFASDLSVG